MENEHPAVSPGVPTESAQDAPAEPTRPSRRAAWIGMGAVVVALVLLSLLPDNRGPEQPPPSADQAAGGTADEDAVFVGKAAPLHFTLKDMNGVDVSLASFKGKVILLNFWATWCGPCKAEIPDLVELQAQYRDDLVVLGFSVDDTVEKLLPYASEYKINYPVLVGNGREDVQDAYGPLWGIPVSVIIGRDGTIAKKHSGIASKEQFEREIKSLL